MLRTIGPSLMLFFATAVAASAEPSLVEKEWTVGDISRQALVYIPAAARQTAAPLVFAFHGHGGNMNQAARSFSYHTVWPEAIVVYMQGLKTPGKLTDPQGRLPGWQSGSGDQDDRDLKFFDAVLASLKSDVKVDEKRIYATGHSNGGGFTYLLWATRGDVFAAVAPSAAVTNRDFKKLTPKPVLHVAGTNDNLVKWEWQKLMIDAVRKLNGCDADGTEWDKSGELVGTIYASKTGTPVVTLISPGNHRFPGDAPKLIVKFFKEHSKK
jgi:polyhydroxybutyrate depolymerase